jgi:hypothetical protein
LLDVKAGKAWNQRREVIAKPSEGAPRRSGYVRDAGGVGGGARAYGKGIHG